MTKYNYAVFIGSFSPFHNAHRAVVLNTLKSAEKVILVVGKANEARNTRQPFSDSEREVIIRASLPVEVQDRVLLTFSMNYLYDDAKWIADVQEAVDDVIPNKNATIALTGMNKDATSYYLNIFPQWNHSIQNEAVKDPMKDKFISSTDIREMMFDRRINEDKYLSFGARELIKEMMQETVWDRLFSDKEYERGYEAKWGKGPHTTVDSCVIQAGHVLLIKRGREYGHGLFALPGGFVNPDETLDAAKVRELREETGLKVPAKVLQGSVKRKDVYDYPYRSNRSRIITHVSKYVLQDVPTGLPKVKGMDDAMEAHWVPISKILDMRGQFFEDHFSIISDMLNI